MRVVLLALAVALAPAVLHAKDDDNPGAGTPRDFKLCDGYGAPNRNGDGMTKIAGGFLGLFRMAAHAGDGNKSAPLFSTDGLEACNRALSQTDRLLPNYHLRRASLLRARGLHRLGLDQFEEAIADLDAADAEGRLSGERLYDRSMGVGNRLFHAYALTRIFRGEEAAPLLAEVRNMRPYSAKVTGSAALVGMEFEPDWVAYQGQIDAMATFHPEMRKQLFYMSLDNEDFAKAVETRPQLDFTPPLTQVGGYRISGIERIHARLFVDEFVADTQTIFALAALGRDGDAAELMATLSARLDTTMQDLPLTERGRKPPKRDRTIHSLKKIFVPMMRNLLVLTEGRLAMLATAKEGDDAAFFTKAEEITVPQDGIGLHMLGLLKRNLEPGAGMEMVDAEIAKITEARAEKRQPPELTLENLYNAMPGAETEDNMPKYKGAKNFLGENTGNGFITKRDGPVIMVNFGGNNATSSMVEEMALLRAAEMAVKAEHSHFALLSKSLTKRQLRTYGMYGGGGSSPMGYSGDVRFITFGAEGPPAPYQAMASRKIDAATIIAELGPVYKTGRPDRRSRR